jgi:hypothetical protein
MAAEEIWLKINSIERAVAARVGGDDEAIRSVLATLREVAKSIEELEKINRKRKAFE